MGVAVSKVSPPSLQPSYDPQTKEYSMTFTGHVSFKTNKTKRKNHDSVHEEITVSPVWFDIVKEIMRESLAMNREDGDDSPSEYPFVHEVRVIMQKDCVKGVLYWKSISLDLKEIADAIVEKALDSLYKNVIRDDSYSWAFSFSPGCLEVN